MRLCVLLKIEGLAVEVDVTNVCLQVEAMVTAAVDKFGMSNMMLFTLYLFLNAVTYN